MRACLLPCCLLVACTSSNSSPSVTLTLTLTHRPNNSSAFNFIVAYQDVDGPWALAPPPVGDDYTLDVSGPRYAVAWTCPTALTAVYTTTDEQRHITATIPDACTDDAAPPPTLATLAGTVDLSAPYTDPTVSFGIDYATVTRESGPSEYTLQAPAATHDLIGSLLVCDFHGQNCVAQNLAIVRNFALQGSMTLDLEPNTVTQQFSSTSAQTILYTAGGSRVGLASPGTGTTKVTAMLQQGEPGDIYEHASTFEINNLRIQREEWLSAAGPYSTTLSAAPAPDATATRNGPGVEMMWIPPAAPSYEWDLYQFPEPFKQTWSGTVSPGYVAGGFDVRTPDLTQLAGWNPALAFDSTRPLNGDTRARTTSAGPSDIPWAYPAPDGTSRDLITGEWMAP